MEQGDFLRMPLPPGSLSDLIYQHPWFIFYSAATTVGAVQKWGSALMKLLILLMGS
jgi:hypothetical protein